MIYFPPSLCHKDFASNENDSSRTLLFFVEHFFFTLPIFFKLNFSQESSKIGHDSHFTSGLTKSKKI